MGNEFARTELLLGSAGLARLQEASVMVVGVGGVGSHCIEALARSGVGKLVLVDHDRVSVTNINRQSIAMHSTVGRYKTRVMKEKIADISPGTEVVTYECFVLPENIGEIFAQKPDYIVDAIDTVTAKLALAEMASELGIPIISSMGTGNKLHAELFEITDISKTSVCPLCKVMRKELRARGIGHLKVLYSPEKPVAAHLPAGEAGPGADRGKETCAVEEPGTDRGKETCAVEEPGTDRGKETCAVEEPGRRRAVPGSVSFVPPVAGLLIAGEVVRELAGI